MIIITNSISLLVISLFKLLLRSVFTGCMSRNFPLSSWLSSLLAHNCSSFLLCFLYLCGVSYFCSFTFDFMWVLFLFFLVTLARVFGFYLSFQKISSWFYWSFLLLLLISVLLFLWSLISPSFCWLSFVCSFITFVCSMFGCLSEVFLAFWEIPVLL